MEVYDHVIEIDCKEYVDSDNYIYLVKTYKYLSTQKTCIIIEELDFERNFIGFMKEKDFNKKKSQLILKGDKTL